ncbi:fibrinogen-like protein A [Anopheles darlingi]|uniref:fibrinogen-like protein A n=1 Tax=Anopheles darlingi TaxID=43151 RepID=UPI0021002166|nr:fibrinogen-like protein A [Anopheles darlingi]
MKFTVCFLLFCAACHLGVTNNSTENSIVVIPDGIYGFGLEMLLTKMENMERKLLEVLEHWHQMESYKAVLEKRFTDSMRDLGRNMSILQDQSLLIVEQPKASATFSSCKAIASKVSGVYEIHINNVTPPFDAFCEQEKFRGGWLVVQHRFDGSVDFYRAWAEYRAGFGDVNTEFWLGLEKMHQLTTARPHEIIIELKDFSGNYAYARYDKFKIGSESEHYTLTLGNYSGTAGDSMGSNNGRRFSSIDRDNGDWPKSDGCVNYSRGAWWHRACTGANLNGPYNNARSSKSMFWLDFKGYQGLSFSRMMIRPL